MSNDTMPCGCEGHADNTDLCRLPALEAELAAERGARRRAERERDEARTAETLWRGTATDVEVWARKAIAEEKTARERAEETHEALLQKLERPLGSDWTPPISMCRTGNVLPGGALEHQAEVMLDEFDLRATASTAGEASAVVMAMLCRELLARLARAEADNAALLRHAQRVAGQSERYEHAECCNYTDDLDETDPDYTACTCVKAVSEAVPEGPHPGAALLEYVQALEKVREAAEAYRLEAAHYVNLDDGSSREEALVNACAAADALGGKS